MYSIEQLQKSFQEHADNADKHREEHLQSFIQSYPDADIPDHLTDPFNLPRALSEICKELLDLRSLR